MPILEFGTIAPDVEELLLKAVTKTKSLVIDSLLKKLSMIPKFWNAELSSSPVIVPALVKTVTVPRFCTAALNSDWIVWPPAFDTVPVSLLWI
ncbi:MAG: hypothetical protein B7Y80_17535 [Hyphomicrobium sp. 32-62-53]|nr:MAG: hypothetical protein B7Z29_17270 [Hyphomicrobium sp. 12-62-95]OYX97952.1 MAG: hypothetical protein B7Y80_17535 [Hyphomicrobium sp. 32-62-53]